MSTLRKKFDTLRHLDWKWAKTYYPKRLRVLARFEWAKLRGIRTYTVQVDGVSVVLGFSRPYHHYIAWQYSKLIGEVNLWKQWIEQAKARTVIYDVGAYNGIYGLFAAKANPNAKVYLFEPDEENAMHVRENIRLNNLTNAFLVPKALWETSGYQNFGGAEGHTASKLGDGDRSVATVSFNEIVQETGVPGLMKLDIEGAEYKVIKSMTQNPAVILLEVHLQWLQGGTKDDLIKELDARHYARSFADDTQSPYYDGTLTEHYWCKTGE